MSKSEKIGGIAFGIAAVVISSWRVGEYFGLDKTTWSGWVQAIGSIAALGVAIWVSAEQHRRQEPRERQREEDEVDGMLRSLRSEVEISFKFIHREIGSAIEVALPNTVFLSVYPISEDPFKIYYGLIPKLGMIKDNELRKQIITTYSQGQSIVLTCRYNNELIERLDQASRITPQGVMHDANAAEILMRTAMLYGDSLRANYAKTKSEVEKLLSMLPKE